MSITAVETDEVQEIDAEDSEAIAPESVPEFLPGGTVRVSDVATDAHGYSSGSVRGKVGTLDFRDAREGWFVRPNDGSWGGYVAPQHLTLLTEAELLGLQVTTLTAELELAQSERTAARDALSRQASEFIAWKENMRTVALAAAERNDLCRVFDQVMEEIGLPGRERDIEIAVNFSGSTTITVPATSRDNARNEIDNEAVLAHLGRAASWSVSLDFDFDDDDDD